MALNKLKKSNRHQYTCPDLIHYRKNQYRLGYLSYALSCLPALFLWLALWSATEDADVVPITEILENAISENSNS